jgi:hypothetical protein
MTDKVITLADPLTGAVSRYRRYSSRLPEFLKVYSPKEGYRVQIKHTDLLSLQQGRLSLLREAVIAGKKPSEIGLPGIENDVNTLVCTATLVDAQGCIVRSASASAKIQGFKDFEALETAANQRLLAALGFGGELFNEDEDRELQSLGGTIASDEGSPASSPASEPQGSVGRDAPSSTHRLSTLDDDEPVSEAERQHIANLARRANTPAPVLNTRADVKAAQQHLMEIVNKRSGHAGSPSNGAGAPSEAQR